MDYESVAWLGTMAVTSAVVCFAGLKLIYDSVQTTIKARYALGIISIGGDSRKYHNDIQDAKIDGLAGLLVGGRKELFRAVRNGRNTAIK